MKLLTVCIPCYNTVDHLDRALEPCLLLKDEIEIIIIDQNSTDGTYHRAMQYQEKYPETVKVIKNDNNVADLKLAYHQATGLYFKYLNCYDWFDRASLVRVMETLSDIIRVQANLDVIVTDYSYGYLKKQRKTSYRKLLPADKIFGWHEIKHFKKNQYLLNHAMILKTQIVKEIIDNFPLKANFQLEILAFGAIPYIRSFCYIDMPLYCFGKNPINYDRLYSLKSDELFELARLYFDYFDIYSLHSRKQRKYMIRYLAMVSLVVTVLLCKKGTQESLQNKEDIWIYLEYTNRRLYNDLKNTVYGRMAIGEKPLSNRLINHGYELIGKLYDL